ncbi:MAG TPA: TolC family protein [Anaeromyxobacteraceae bacterium]|nr:TolC family protein [Anaeromyxobacteraceae bacterium]
MSRLRMLIAAAGALWAAHASALQPLEEFLRGARASHPDNAEAEASRRQTDAAADGELGRALPRLTLRGTYTWSQYDSALEIPGLPPITLTPKESWDGSATLDVPLVDLARFTRIASARSSARAAATGTSVTDLQVQARVAQGYYQLLANQALVASSRRALAVAQSSLRIAEQRHAAGAAPLLDVDRARAEVERNVQQLAASELQASVVARALQSATGLSPELQGEVAFGDDLHEEPPLEQFQVPDDRIPSLASAMESRRAAEQQASAQRLTLVPTLRAGVTESVNNVGVLPGHKASAVGVVALTWSFDLTTLADIRAQDAAADVARAREQRARLAARDAIHDAWMTVRTNVARSRSARVQAQVSSRASELALERYRVGDATQLDLLQAQRDAFAADAARIQADADLVNSRSQLRLAAGESLLSRSGGTP